MKQLKLGLLAIGIAMVSVGCYSNTYSDHHRHRVHEPAGAVIASPHHTGHYHYTEHGVGRQYHRHYYRHSH